MYNADVDTPSGVATSALYTFSTPRSVITVCSLCVLSYIVVLR